MADCYIILDERRSLLELILLVLACHKKTIGTHHKKDTLLSLSGAEKLKLEDAKLILFLFCHHCSRFTKDVTIDNYLKITGRAMQNKDPIRRSVKRLSALRIIYLNHNGKRQEQKLFKMCKLKRGKISYRINSFFESKLSIRGRGHREQKVKAFLFKDKQYRSYRYNSIRLVVLLNLLYCFDDSNLIDKETLVSETENIIALINDHFDHRIRNLDPWICQSREELLRNYISS